MNEFKLTPKWVLNNLPQSYAIIDEELGMMTDIELDFVLIKQALQTLGIQYIEGEYKSEGVINYGVIFQVEDIRQFLYQKLKELKQIQVMIKRKDIRLPEKGEVLFALRILSYGLLVERAKTTNESNIVDELYSSLNEMFASKCKFFRGSEGVMHYIFKDQSDESWDTEEHELILMIGKFAWYKINLEYLELRNPKLKGLNKILSDTFPEIYDAYTDFSKKFGFNGTARLVTDPFISKKGVIKYLQNPGIVEWDSDLLELNENYLEEEEVKQSTSNVNERNGFLPPIQKQKSINCKSESHSFSVN